MQTRVPHKLFQAMICERYVLAISVRPLKRVVEETTQGLFSGRMTAQIWPKGWGRCLRSPNCSNWGKMVGGMKPLIKKHDFGVIAARFEASDLANVLNSLNEEHINDMKIRALMAAEMLNADVEMGKVLSIYRKLIGR